MYNAKNLKKALKYANKVQADYALIIGDEEAKTNSCSVKNLETGEQKLIKESLILKYFKNA